jgi:hypothetical protein
MQRYIETHNEGPNDVYIPVADTIEFEPDFMKQKFGKFTMGIVWNIGMGGSIMCMPLIHGDKVYFGCGDHHCTRLTGRRGQRCGNSRQGTS